MKELKISPQVFTPTVEVMALNIPRRLRHVGAVRHNHLGMLPPTPPSGKQKPPRLFWARILCRSGHTYAYTGCQVAFVTLDDRRRVIAVSGGYVETLPPSAVANHKHLVELVKGDLTNDIVWREDVEKWVEAARVYAAEVGPCPRG